MDVVAIVPAREHVCTRYRVAQFARHLEGRGLTLRIEPLAQNLAQRVRQVTRSRAGQIVFLQRKLIPIWQLLLLRQASPMLVYDFDDAVYLRDSHHRRGPYSLTRSIRFQATVSLADLVIAGNRFLADEAARRRPGANIEIIPTCVDPHRYRLAEHDQREPTRLVWIGSSSTYRTLEAARGTLETVGQAVPNTMLRVICDRFPTFKNLRVEPAPWSQETETHDLKSSDIGISWIPDDLWSRGKCGLKVLQYMAAGLPVVASPVGVHREMVAGGGFLASDPDDWADKVHRLVVDHHLRRSMGREGRDALERQFHVDTWGSVLADRLALVAERV